MSANYPPLQDGKGQEAGNRAGGGQQEAPDAQALVVELQEAQDVAAPRLTNHTVPGRDVAPAEPRQHLGIPDGRREGGQEAEQRQPRRRREGQRHPRHHGKLDPLRCLVEAKTVKSESPLAATLLAA